MKLTAHYVGVALVLLSIVVSSRHPLFAAAATDTDHARWVQVTTLLRFARGAEDILKEPSGVAVTRAGDVYVADAGRHIVLRIAPDGRISSVGSGKPGLDDGPVAVAAFKAPNAVAIDEARGVVYVADTGNHVIRRIDIAAGTVTTVAGSGTPGNTDGSGTAVQFSHPASVAVSAGGTVYVADTVNHNIRSITPDGFVSTVAGRGTPGFADGSVAQALFHAPHAIAVRHDAIYVADTENHRIRRIANGVVTTIAGTGQPGNADGAAMVASFHGPAGVALLDDGNVIVADTRNHTLRVIADGYVETIAGDSTPGFADATGDLSAARFAQPRTLAVAGFVAICDTHNDAIRLLIPSLRPPLTVTPSTGPMAGGNEVHLDGSGFMAGRTSIRFGDAISPSVTFVSSSELRVTVPPAAAGPVDVAATTPGGSATLADGYLYLAPPNISRVEPRKGASSGGNTITLFGSELVDAHTSVLFGSFPATDVVVASPSSLTATTPPHAAGTVDIQLETPGGTATAPGAFRYFAPPVIHTFAPAAAGAGDTVVISGANFDEERGGNDVRFGGIGANVIAEAPTELTVAVPQGSTSAPIAVTTAGGTAQTAVPFVVRALSRLEITPSQAEIQVGPHLQLTALAIYSDGSTRDATREASWTAEPPTVAGVDERGLVRAIAAGTAVVRATVGAITATSAVTVAGAVDLPPDPATVAPPLDPTVPASFADSTAFLYSGTIPIQREVATNAIVRERVAVIRGKVTTRDGAPLPGARVSILNAPALGWTLSRANGEYDLAVNGGGAVTLVVSKDGHLPAQRVVTPRWKAFAFAADVALVPLDGRVTAIEGGSATTQVARGNPASDEDGVRTATVIFPPGTTATMTLPGGSVQPLPAWHVRATEYTVGTNGPAAMPAPLPTHAAYTYCVELSADEAVAANASTVRFSQPVAFYVENFLRFPVGEVVPVGYYDRERAVWIASRNGVVLGIVDVAGGLAAVDVTGDGIAEPAEALAVIGMGEAERAQLASLYEPGMTLWRATLDHFTPVDLNWAVLPDGSFGPPDGTGPWGDLYADDACQVGGSIIECQSQVLGESLAVTGTPYRLEYRSSRVPGRSAATTLDVVLTTEEVPTARSIELTVNIAGREVKRSFAPAAHLTTAVEWDGRDAYGRAVQGSQEVTASITYVYPAFYASSPAGFNLPPLNVVLGPARTEMLWTENYSVSMASWDAAAAGLGRWTLDAHDTFDVEGNIVYHGDGSKRTLGEQAGVVKTMAGRGYCQTGCSVLNGTPATQAALGPVGGIVAAPDGTVFFTTNHRIARVDGAGKYWLVAGISQGDTLGRGDGGPALNAGLYAPQALALGPDGALYVSEPSAGRVRRIAANGTITRFAGRAGFNAPGFAGDGGPAAEAAFKNPWELAVGPDGSVYINDKGNFRIRRIGTDGIITTIAGNGQPGFDVVDDVPATSTSINPNGMAVGVDGTLYILDRNARVRAVGQDGIIRTVAEPLCAVATGDCALTLSGRPKAAISVTLEGTLIVSTISDNKLAIHQIDGTGAVTLLAGGAAGDALQQSPPSSAFFAGDHGPATAATYSYVQAIAVAPDRALLIADSGNYRIRRVAAPAAIPRGEELLLPYGDGRTLAVFDRQGRHLRTIDSLTGTPLLTFGYDGQGYLASMRDAYGNETTIERGRAGTGEIAIVAPGGQRTTLTVDGSGNMASVANPAGETTHLEATSDGLLLSLTQPSGSQTRFTYSPKGLLIRDADAAGGAKDLGDERKGEDVTVTMTTALGRTTRYADVKLKGDDRRRTVTRPDGTTTTSVTEGRAKTTITTATGSMTTAVAPDPRFGMMAPFTGAWTALSGSRRLTASVTRTSQLATTGDPLSVTRLSETASLNGKAYSWSYEAATRRATSTSPGGRSVTTVLNEKGAVAAIEAGGLTPLTIGYDAFGRVASLAQGPSRTLNFTYDEAHRLEAMQDALGRAVRFTYDAADRVITQTLPDDRVIAFEYDVNGNLTAVTPHDRPVHRFGFTAVDLPNEYATSGAVSRFVYDADRQLTSMISPDGTRISLGYDGGGRVSSVTAGAESITYGYDPAGRFTTASSRTGTIRYGWDGALVTSIAFSGDVAGTLTYGYDNELRVTSESVDGASIAFGYDADSLLTSAGALTLTRNAQHGVITATNLGGIRDTRIYDSLGELTSYSATFNEEVLLAFNWTRDATGRITAIGSQGYEYDAAGRLARVTLDGAPVAEYDYDTNGNRTAHRWLGGSAAGTYDAQDQLLAYGDTTYTYTANGELKTKTVAGAETTFGYDGFGNLRSVSLPGRTVEYVVDANGRRVGKKVNGTLVQGWLYADQLRIVAELDGAGTVVSRFVYATRTNVPDSMVKGGITYRILSDHLGSPRLVVDAATGTVAQRLEYDAFGSVTTDTAPGFQPFGFAGGLYDRDTGFVRFGARDYDAQAGRWTSKDPIGFAGGSANLYSYSFNDPVNFIDPTGFITVPGVGWVDLGEGAGAAALSTYADVLSDPDAAWYEKAGAAVGGVFSALWTPETSDATATTLSCAIGGPGVAARRPYWRYIGPKSGPGGKWLTRGWRPPYGTNYARAKDALQLPQTPTGVVRVRPGTLEPVAGPRAVGGNPSFGSGGGTEYYRGWGFPN